MSKRNDLLFSFFLGVIGIFILGNFDKNFSQWFNWLHIVVAVLFGFLVMGFRWLTIKNSN